VHLKEMHRCTVDGCTMMFSSRRSRNRHSANPNPKLHLPQTVRRKLPDNAGGLGLADSATGDYEDDDGGSGGGGGVYPGSPMSLSSQYALRCAAEAAGSAVHRQMVLDNDEEDDDDDVASNHSTAAESMSTVPEDNFMMSAAAVTSAPSTPSSDTALNLVCSPRSSSSVPSTGNGNVGLEMAEPELGVSGNTAGASQMSVRGTSKRKSAVPTRCSTQQLQDDELISSDNSSDVPASKRRNIEPATANEVASTSDGQTTEAQPEKSLEPNNNKVHGQGFKTEEDQENGGSEDEEEVDGVVGSGTADVESQPVPRTSTPTGSDLRPADQGPGSPNACSHISDDVSSIGSDEDRKSEKAVGEDRDAAEAGNHGAAAQSDHEDVNDSGVVVDRAGRRDDELSGSKTVPDAGENGIAIMTRDGVGKGSTQTGFVCLVEGCNATFPSKRSRDRHSANLNLHRKLLSTSGTSGKATAAMFSEHPFPPPIVVHGSPGNATDEAGCLVLNLSRTADTSAPTSGPETRSAVAAAAAVSDPADAVGQGPDTDGEASRSSSVGPEDESGMAGDSTTVTCHICPPPSTTFRDKLALKEHLETIHPRETHRCTVAGCDKLFSTRKSRNRHSQNDNLHRHLVVAAPRQ